MIEKGVIVIVFILLSGCLFHSQEASLEIISIGEPDMVYHFGDRVVVNVTVKSPDILKNITVKISGLKNKLGQSKLHGSKNVDLDKGINIIPFNCWIPTCSPCNKLYPGTYYINATILRNGEIIAEGTATVELRN